MCDTILAPVPAGAGIVFCSEGRACGRYPAWKWLLAVLFVAGSALCSGTETALTALGDAGARQLRDRGGRRARMLLGLWVDHPERVLSTLLIGNTLVNMGSGALAAALAIDLSASAGLAPASAVALTTAS